MIIKIVTLFLIAMGVMAMFGKLRIPGPGGRSLRLGKPRKCPHCGRYLLGKGDCPCRKG
ncbi:hypothetical protein Ga0609869_001156 [Rhodovulum iodosum]|uniref:Short-chain dehydrogenase n=1 Tax=Rhodovulum iodosum TaxID=68291 RepID=A0ABV3XR60_9RHOB|nr:hypothetical protein [Rhodovulum robiginosum]